ncbi:hypothetical protein [Parendozoicomonas sp. Alg238-R29]|nr:hypothetical protein [Parendozoicomonas sp. Alg238-R29]
MGNERSQGLKVLLLTACIISSNFIATRPASDALTEKQEKSPQIILALR